MVQSPTYIVRATIGTPLRTLLMSMDTSNDTAWIPCTDCSSTVFDNAKSTTFHTLGCQALQCKQVPNPSCNATTNTCVFNMTYGGSTIAVNLSQDTTALATDSVPGYTFGCVQQTTGNSVPPQGLLGLGRAPEDQSTPLLKNPRKSSLYFVNLIGIRVGNRIVDIPPSAIAFNTTTGAGTITDSGCQRDDSRNIQYMLHNVPIVAPTITLMFAGMNVTLPEDNLLIHSTASSITCLAMASAPDNMNSVLNVIANMQQQNHRILFDVPNLRLGVSRELCS
ncbi:thioredoxin-like protein CITRX [Hibiscus syriacus]|uniref:Thioredoxin-like protein CITRX n=1 Tax=Hibiscus syriacus TaxID=106335 RepID=A0A6A2YYI1_HIBSY|nr:thioredoxin-like protein CITRX [Hibiscus syriacus]